MPQAIQPLHATSDLSHQLSLWNDRAEKVKCEAETLQYEKDQLEAIKQKTVTNQREAEEKAHQCRKTRALLADIQNRNQTSLETRSKKEADVVGLRRALETEAHSIEMLCRDLDERENHHASQFEAVTNALAEQEAALQAQLRRFEEDLLAKRALLTVVQQEHSAALLTQERLQEWRERVNAEKQTIQALQARTAAQRRERDELDSELASQRSKREVLARQLHAVTAELTQQEQYLQQLHSLTDLVQSAKEGVEEVKDISFNITTVQAVLAQHLHADSSTSSDGRFSVKKQRM